MSISQITIINCDGCQEKLDCHHPALFENLHYCKTCCKKLLDYERRVCHNEVPSRRGGYRVLGEYDG